jgi:hypothetical protein
MGQCGTMAGGRHRKGHKTRKTRRGGAGYGFNGAIGANGPEWAATSTSTPMKPDGTVDTKFGAADTATNSVVGGRRRVSRKSRKGKSKKGGKKSRKSRGRKMRGGASEYNVGAVRAEFTGNTGTPGSFTYGTYASAPSKVGGYGPTAGADGVMKTT